MNDIKEWTIAELLQEYITLSDQRDSCFFGSTIHLDAIRQLLTIEEEISRRDEYSKRLVVKSGNER